MAILAATALAASLFSACDSGITATSPTPDSVSTSSSTPSTAEPAPTAATTVAAPATAPPTSDTVAPNAIIQPGPMLWERIDFGTVSAYLIIRDGFAALIDVGPAGGTDLISAALQRVGLDWSAVGDIILTHPHPDHAGGLEDVRRLAPGAIVWAGVGGPGAVDTPAEINELRDGLFVFGLQVAATPGHAPSHLSLFDPIEGVLFAGDAVRGADAAGGRPGEIALPVVDSSADAELAAASVAYLASLQPTIVLCGHGAPITVEASRKLAALAGERPAG